jgi:uncharacterized membrane protein
MNRKNEALIACGTEKEILIAWFGALCFFLSTIEYMIPKPLPFLRLGIANLPIMLSIGILPIPAYCALVLVKILGQGLIGGTLFSYIFLFSAAGSVSSAFVMIALKKLLGKRVSWIGISVAGAFTSNIAQLSLARYWIFGESAWYIAPPFIAVGIASGALLGAFANHYAKNSAWYADAKTGNISIPESFGMTDETGKPGAARAGAFEASLSRKRIRFPAGIALILALMFVDNMAAQGAILALAVILALADRSRIGIIPVFTMSASIILFNVFVPFGKILATPFGLPITEGALLLGIKKALVIEGMIFVSRWMLRPGLQLPGKAGALVAQAFGILRNLSAGKKRIDPKRLVESIDDVMYGRG